MILSNFEPEYEYKSRKNKVKKEQTANCQLQTANCKLPTANCQLQTVTP
jgi:hypothetical protein